MEIRKVIMIGCGLAGLTADLYAGRANLKPLVLAGLTYGGQLMITSEVENFPGFPQGIMGPELMQNMIEQSERFGAEIVYEDVSKVDFSKKPFTVWTGEKEYQSESVIIATGASSMWLGLPSEERTRGKSITISFACARV